MRYFFGLDRNRSHQTDVMFNEISKQANPGDYKFAFGFMLDGSKVLVKQSVNASSHALIDIESQASPIPGMPSTAIAAHPSGKEYFFSTNNSPFWRVVKLDPESTLTLQSTNVASVGAAYTPDGTRLVVSRTQAPSLYIYDTSDYSDISSQFGTIPTISNAGIPAASPDSSKVAITSFNAIYVLDLSDKVVRSYPNTYFFHRGGAYSEDGTKLLVFTFSGSAYYLRVLDASTMVQLTQYSIPHTPAVNADVNLNIFRCDYTKRMFILTSGGVYLMPSDLSSAPEGPIFITNSVVQSMAAYHDPADTVTLRGEVRDIGGNLVSRKVRVFVRSTGLLAGEAVSGSDGQYEIDLFDGNVEYDVQFMAASGEQLNDIFQARATG